MKTSTVKWFDAKKGYGFIHHPDDGEDVFVHYSNIQSDDDFKTLKSEQRVQFEMNDGPKGLHALDVVALRSVIHLKLDTLVTLQGLEIVVRLNV